MGGMGRRLLVMLTATSALIAVPGLLTAAPRASAAVMALPGAPQNVAAAPADHGAVVSWKAPASNGGSPIAGYVITASPGGKRVKTSNVTRYLVGGLTNGRAYTFTVAAVTAAGTGPASKRSASVTPHLPPVPSPVRSVKVSVGFRQLAVSWRPPSTEAPIFSYLVSATPGKHTLTVSGDTLSTVIRGLRNGTRYAVSVVAVNGTGRARATRAPRATPAVTKPAAPSGVTAVPVSSGAKVSWQPPASTGGAAITGFVITVVGAHRQLKAGRTARSIVVAKLTKGHSYTFTVAARNARGIGKAATSPAATDGGKVGKKTVVLSKSSLAALSQVETDGTLVFPHPTAQARELAAADIVVAGVGGATPGGLLVKVTSVTSAGSQLLVHTRPAALDDALTAGAFGTTATLTSGKVARFIPARSGVRLMTTQSARSAQGSAGFGLSVHTVLYKSGDGRTVIASGSVSVTPNLSFSASVSCCVHVNTKFSATVTASASVSLTAQLSHQISGDFELGEVEFEPLVFDVLGVPVVIVPTLAVDLTAKGSVTAGLVAGASQSLTVGAQVTTSGSKVSASPVYSHTSTWTPPTLFGTFSAAGGVKLDFSATVDDIPGPDLVDTIYLLELTVDPSKNPWWELSEENVIELDYDLSCVAGGEYSDASGHRQGLLLSWSGSAWSATKASLPAGASTDPQVAISAIACHSATACVAVGSYLDSSSHQQALLLTRSGTSWSALKAPLPASGGTTAELTAAACLSATKCATAGFYTDSADRQHALLLTGFGNSWTALNAPVPAGASASPEAFVESIACAGTGACIAVGAYNDSAGHTQGLVLTGLGLTWKAAKAPMPSGAAADPGALLDAVACHGAGACVAVGNYLDGVGDQHGVLLTGADSGSATWKAAKAPLPADVPVSQVLSIGAVACPSSCVAVGASDLRGLVFTGPS